MKQHKVNFTTMTINDNDDNLMRASLWFELFNGVL